MSVDKCRICGQTLSTRVGDCPTCGRAACPDCAEDVFGRGEMECNVCEAEND